ncbi:MAG: protein-glutamate O-methyltransferase CheR [Verrucomicrobiia bacterium]
MAARHTGDHPETEIDPATFRRIAEIVYQKAGIVLNKQKEALVVARIGKRMRRLGITHFRDYLHLLEESPEHGEPVEMLNAISTNVTQFFREQKHFEDMAGWLVQWQQEGRTSFRFWCAASASGEEAYSMAMVVRENLPADCDVRILATDLSTSALAEAREGVYVASDMKTVPEAFARRYFACEQAGTGRCYRVSPALAGMITFARLNLAQTPYAMRGPFDAIFCRNAMIYFDDNVRRRLLDECWRLLRLGGYLVVGSAESLAGLPTDFKNVAPSVYVKK